MGSDTRFDDIRSHFFKFFGTWDACSAFFFSANLNTTQAFGSVSSPYALRSAPPKSESFDTGQILWVWVVSLPVIILNSPGVSRGQSPAFGTASDILGVIIWVVGWAIESIADWQKSRYKAAHPPREKPIDVSVECWLCCEVPCTHPLLSCCRLDCGLGLVIHLISASESHSLLVG